jgi:hypothetical protein
MNGNPWSELQTRLLWLQAEVYTHTPAVAVREVQFPTRIQNLRLMDKSDKDQV